MTGKQSRWIADNFLAIVGVGILVLYVASRVKPVVYRPKVVGVNWTQKKAHIKYRGKDFVYDFQNPSSEMNMDDFIVYFDPTTKSVEIKESGGKMVDSEYQKA